MGRTLRWVIAVTALAAAALAGARPSHAAVPAGRIAYVHQKDEGVYALRTIKPDGTGMREVVGPKQGYRRPTPPRYSPDGKQLAFSNRRRRARPGPLWLATAAGKSVREVPVDLDWPLPVALSWAPNGRRMVMAEARTSADHRMHVVRIDGSRRRLLGKGRDPVWSPDGRRIAFHGASGVWVVRPNGSGRRLLANATDVVGGGLAISPDGRDLLYARAPLMGGLEWWIVPMSGGQARHITTQPRLGIVALPSAMDARRRAARRDVDRPRRPDRLRAAGLRDHRARRQRRTGRVRGARGDLRRSSV